LVTEEIFKDILNTPKISIANKLLIILSSNSNQPKTTEEIIKLCKHFGVRGIDSSKVSVYLHRTGGKAIKTPKGWELTLTGIKHVSKTFGLNVGESEEPHDILTTKSLRSHLQKISNPNTRSFVEESITDLENKSYRSAVVLSWVGAMSVLYDYVISKKLKEFNAEAIRRDAKFKPIITPDDFRTLKESTFLDILESISLMGGDVKRELKKCLDLRNSCGHPNTLKIGENRVAAHIEDLILNVFSTYY
jgi:hypothetical protein